MTARHLISYGDLSLLSDVDVNYLAYAGSEVVRVVSVINLDINYYTVSAVRHSEGGVLNLARLLAEDRTEKSFLRSKLGLTLGCYLTYKDIACANLGTDSDDTVLVKILERILGYVGDLTGDLLRWCSNRCE